MAHIALPFPSLANGSNLATDGGSSELLMKNACSCPQDKLFGDNACHLNHVLVSFFRA
jgi:hypothetical protein